MTRQLGLLEHIRQFSGQMDVLEREMPNKALQRTANPLRD
jgi:hypothetical protein